MSDKKKSINLSISPITNTAKTVAVFNHNQFEHKDIPVLETQLENELNKQIGSLQNGDLSTIEAMLYSQAITLQEVFNKYVMYLSLSETPNLIQVISQIAIKAQNACRATLATLADIKRPNKIVFVRQQNNALNQQINCSQNVLPENIHGNELLTAENNHETLDPGRTNTPIRIDKELEAVEISRCEDATRQRN